jgi:folate-binding protein YgfZ
MTSDWIQLLAARGGRIVDGQLVGFGDPAAELRESASGSVIAPLTQFGVLDFSGPDAAEFLHNQLSCDVKGLPSDRSTFGTYNTAKGRMLASFLVWRTTEGFRMVLPRAIAPAVQKRLQMFVLRAKVKIADRSDADVLIGVSGAAAPGVLARFCGAPPVNEHDLHACSDGVVVRVPRDRFILAIGSERAPELWNGLAQALRPVGPDCWHWLDIVNGIAFVTAATQDQLVPQMANMELVGGVNFKKGCYPGQEIVARTQYLGKLKRRMYLAHVEANVPPAPGAELFSEDVNGQANGLIVAAAAAPTGGYDCLAVVQSASASASTVRVGAPDGPVLAFRPLPYPVE